MLFVVSSGDWVQTVQLAQIRVPLKSLVTKQIFMLRDISLTIPKSQAVSLFPTCVLERLRFVLHISLMKQIMLHVIINPMLASMTLLKVLKREAPLC